MWYHKDTIESGCRGISPPASNMQYHEKPFYSTQNPTLVGR